MPTNLFAKHHGLALLPLLIVFAFASLALPASAQQSKAKQLSKESVADAVTQHARKSRFPNKLKFIDERGNARDGVVEYLSLIHI